MRELRRTVTVLFTDLVGSTELSERLGSADSGRLVGRHFAALRDSLAVFRGTEVKLTGDGMMVVFESAIEGVGCAITMQQSVARQNRRQPDWRVAMRVGISAGEASARDGDWYGTPIVEASRLCAAAGPGEILAADLVHALAARSELHRLDFRGVLSLKGLSQPMRTWSVDWDESQEFALRVALADDAVLLREGVASALESAGLDVVMQASDADTVIRCLEVLRPHVVVLDVRMPPTFRDEGLVAAAEIRRMHPEVGVLVLSASIDSGAARRLLESSTHGIGYLLKDRVADMDELTAAIRTIASGGTAIDPEVLALLD